MHNLRLFVPTTLVVCGSSFLPALSTDKDNIGKWLCTHTLATRTVVIIVVIVVVVVPLPSNIDYTRFKAKNAYM